MLDRKLTMGASCLALAAVLALAHNSAAAESAATTKTTAEVLVPMVAIPGGAFEMGATYEPVATPVHQVTLSPFEMAKTETTYAQWKKVLDWALEHGYYFDPAGRGLLGGRYHGGDPITETDATHPATRIGWWEAVTWCNALSEMEGRTPCYYSGGDKPEVFRGVKEPKWEGMSVRWDVDGYRLPTEAEWEYACRAGTSTRFYWGDDVSIAGQYANMFDETSQAKYHEPTHVKTTDGFTDTSPAGSLKPNAFGLYDMSGSVWEWCHDYYGPYTAEAVTDPKGPDAGEMRSRRGGCFQIRNPHDAQSMSRQRHEYDDRGQLGFRVAISGAKDK